MAYRLLDLFCGEGGAGAGYAAAGFEVTGVDLQRIGNYPGRFVRGDALAYLAAHGTEYDAIHASPPCQAFSTLRHANPDESHLHMFEMPDHPELIEPTRAGLMAAGVPWIIENVVGAPLIEPVVLCGSMFELGGVCRDGTWRQLRRHRLFESSADLAAPGPCRHTGQPVGIHGTGGAHQNQRGYQADKDTAIKVMRMPWATRRGVSQAIPPAYTRHLGIQLMAAVAGVSPSRP